MALIGQVDPTNVILEASKLEGGSSAIGWLFVVLGLLIAALGYAVYFLFKRLDKARDEKGELLERSYKITETVAKQFDEVSDDLNEVKGELKLQSALIQTLIGK